MAEALALETDKVLAEKGDGIGWMTFNNPERHNAISMEMWAAIADIVEDFQADDGVRVVVVKGAGDRAFASGADISQFDAHRANAAQAATYGRSSGRGSVARLEKPLIAMIHGYCLGGGLRFALNADIRIASEDAQFGIPAARLGLGYGYESLKPLADLVGPAMTKEILYTARRLSAEEALRIGLVNKVVPRGELEPTVRGYAAMIVENAPLTVRSVKLIMGELAKDSDKRDMTLAKRVVDECFDSEDYAEGRRAFMEKRKPVFRGR